MSKHDNSTRFHLRKVLEENVGKEYDIRDLADIVEDKRGIVTDRQSISSAIKTMREIDRMNIVNIGVRMYKYIGKIE